MLALGRPEVEKLLDLDALPAAFAAARAELEPRSRDGVVALGEIIVGTAGGREIELEEIHV